MTVANSLLSQVVLSVHAVFIHISQYVSYPCHTSLYLQDNTKQTCIPFQTEQDSNDAVVPFMHPEIQKLY